MTAPVLPFIPAAVRALLISSADFTALVPATRVATRVPASVAAPCAVVKAPPATPVEVAAGVWAPLVQVEGYCPPGGSVDPEVVVWQIAATAAPAWRR